MVQWNRPGKRLKFRVVGIQNQPAFAGNLRALLGNQRRITAAHLGPNNQFLLVRQADNKHDPNAVLVYIGQYPIGYVPRRCCTDCGDPATALQQEDKCLTCGKPLTRLADTLARSIDAGVNPPIQLETVAETKGLFAAFTIGESDVHYPEATGQIQTGEAAEASRPEEGS